MVMPMMVERGMVRSGSFTSPAGTVADSGSNRRDIVNGAKAAVASAGLALALTQLRHVGSM